MYEYPNLRNDDSLYLQFLYPDRNFHCNADPDQGRFARFSCLIIIIIVIFSGVMLVWGRGVGAPTSVDQLRSEMSLFHDFKLKRRKVDSRCSTEGEQLGT